jgi:hypothetical protein
MRTSIDTAIERVRALHDDKLKVFIQETAAAHAQLTADLIAAAAALENRGVAERDGYKDRRAAQLFKQLTRWSLNDSRNLMKVARLTTRQPVGGSSFAETEFPAMAAALADGAINTGHVREIINAMSVVPPDWPSRDGYEDMLAGIARAGYPEDVKEAGKAIANHIEQETPPPDDDDERQAEPDRKLRVIERLDGRVLISGSVDKETAVQLQAVLNAFAKPRSKDDTRSKERRQGDAIAELIHHGVTCTGVLPNDTRPQIIFTLSWEDLQKDVHRILMGGYGVLSPEAARRLCCDANILPIVMNGEGLALDVGSASRTATTAIRRALVLRDGGCTFPGCDRPAYWCDAHHVKAWEFGGRTALNNMVLLCLIHHQILHHSEWSILMLGGIPHFVPPEYIDPSQTPIRHARFSMKC